RRDSARRQRAARPARERARAARPRLRAGRARGADLRQGSGRGPAAAMMVELRKLKLRDLGAIDEIERASYPTPWSRSMFAGERAKPSSLSLGAFDPDTGELLGYLIISRYVDAWHVMNLAVAPAHRRRKIASMLLDRLFDETA